MAEPSGSRSRAKVTAEDVAIDEAKGRAASLLDSALLRLRDGVAPNDAELDTCANAFAAFFALLSRRNDGVENWRFRDDDRASLYVEALKLTALGHPAHGAWHGMSTLRRHVLKGVLSRLREGDDPWLRLCAVTAALASDSLEHALDSYARIADDPFLSHLVVRWAKQVVIAFSFCNDVADYEAFLERTSRADAWSVGLPPGERWVLHASIFPDPSRDPRTTVEEPGSPSCQRRALERDWEIVDRAGAIDKLTWLRTAGHRTEVRRDLAVPSADGATREYVETHRQALGRHESLAWDVSRLVATARTAYAVGYIDGKEIDELLDWAARTLLETYDSWAEVGDDYVLGCGYWSPSDVGRCSRCATVAWLKDDPRSPWRRVGFGSKGTLPPAARTKPPKRRARASILLEFPAELFGIGLGALLLWLLPLGTVGAEVVGAGVPALVIGARERWWPDLFPTPRVRPPRSVWRTIAAYLLTIAGGVLLLLFGLLFHAGATDEKHPEIVVPFLVIALLGAWMTLAGLRRLR